jgi:hypothetical protein
MTEIKKSNNKYIKVMLHSKYVEKETEYEKEYKKEQARKETMKRKDFLKKHNQEKINILAS